MKTKCIVLGESQPSNELKKIEFVRCIDDDDGFPPSSKPSEYAVIELISREYANGHDLMFAYFEDRSEGCAYFGHWNDGVV